MRRPSFFGRLSIRAATRLAFRRVRLTGLENLSSDTIDIIVADVPAQWTGALLLTSAIPSSSLGIVYGSSEADRAKAAAIGWLSVGASQDQRDTQEMVDDVVARMSEQVPFCSTFVLSSRAFPEPTFASDLALSLATSNPERPVRLVPAGIRRVSSGVGRESVLLQLGSPISVFPLRIGQRWQRNQRAAELTRLVEQAQDALVLNSSDWSALLVWDVVCRLYQRQHMTSWRPGTSQRLYEVLQQEADGQLLGAQIAAWLVSLDAAGLEPSHLDRSLPSAPAHNIQCLLELLLLPLTLIGGPLLAGIGVAGRLATAQMVRRDDLAMWRLLSLAFGLIALILLVFPVLLAVEHGPRLGGAVLMIEAAASWVTFRITSQYTGWLFLWKRITQLGQRSRVYAWAWQERASLIESVRGLVARPRGDEPPLFPRSMLE